MFFKHVCLQTWSALTVYNQRGGSAHALFALCDTEGTYAWWTRSAIREPLAPGPSNHWCSRTCWGRPRMDRTTHRPGRGGRYREPSSGIMSPIITEASVITFINKLFSCIFTSPKAHCLSISWLWHSFYWQFKLTWNTRQIRTAFKGEMYS